MSNEANSEVRVLEPIVIDKTTAKAFVVGRNAAGKWVVGDEGTPDGFMEFDTEREARRQIKIFNKGGGFFGFTPPFIKRTVQPLLDAMSKGTHG